jgi:thiol-disulfide isomerase/thioredoxin
MPSKRTTKLGKVSPYIDVRSPKDVSKFESLLSSGPTLVLIYADWCGHCQRFKQEMWNECANSSNKSMNTAAVHFDMVENTSMKSAPVEGYPTLFEVKSPNSSPTVVPTPRSKEELETLVNENTLQSERMVANSQAASRNTFVPEDVESLPPATEKETVSELAAPGKQGGGGQQGGSLFHSLLKVVEDSAHIALLASSAAELHRRFKKRSTKGTKRRRSGASSTRKRR